MAYRFAACRLDPRSRRFERDGEALHLEPQVFDLIEALAEAGGAVLSREDLIARVWGGLAVSDATIGVRINAARRAVGDDGKRQAIIETVARRGFRLVPEVHAEDAAPGRAAPRRIATVAVLPFDYAAEDARDMLAVGIVDEITGALSRVREFDVIARQSAFAPAVGEAGSRDAAATLGADYVVTGLVRRAGERVRISVHLVDGRDGHAIWSRRFDDRLDDLFELQDRIALLVAGQISPSVRTEEIGRARNRPPADRTAYELVLSAYPRLWAHGRADNAEAIGLLEQALDRDPENAHAMALLAWVHAQQSTYMWSADPVADRRRARALAEGAAARVVDHAPTLVALAAAITLSTGDAADATFHVDRALGIDPSNAWGWMRRGWIATFNGDVDRAISDMARAQELSPLDPFRFNMVLGHASALQHWTDRQAEALALVEAALRLKPSAPWIWRMLAASRWRLGDRAGAREAAGQLLGHYPGLTVAYMARALPPGPYGAHSGYLDIFRALGVPEG